MGLNNKILYPRDLAARILARVLSDGDNLETAVSSLASDVSPESRTWLQEICSGTLRWKGRLDFALDSVALKKKPSGWLRRMLLVAGYQLIAQDRVHPGAVVNEAVSEIRRKE